MDDHKSGKTDSLLIVANIKEHIEKMINKALLENNEDKADLFHCSSYVACLISELSDHFPLSWRAAEEFWLSKKPKGNNPYELEAGGKKCFMIHVFFSGLCRKRRVYPEYYSDFGINLFHQHFLRTGREISFLMSNNFLRMARLTKQALSVS